MFCLNALSFFHFLDNFVPIYIIVARHDSHLHINCIPFIFTSHSLSLNHLKTFCHKRCIFNDMCSLQCMHFICPTVSFLVTKNGSDSVFDFTHLKFDNKLRIVMTIKKVFITVFTFFFNLLSFILILL